MVHIRYPSNHLYGQSRNFFSEHHGPKFCWTFTRPTNVSAERMLVAELVWQNEKSIEQRCCICQAVFLQDEGKITSWPAVSAPLP